MKIFETFSAKKMHQRFLSAIIAVLLMLCIFAGEVSFFSSYGAFIANAEELAANHDADTLALDIIDWKINSVDADSLQALVDGYFCENPLNSNVMSYVQAIITAPGFECDFTSYISALSSSLAEAADSEDGIFPTTLQKAIITLCMCRNSSSNSSYSLEDLLSDAVINAAFADTIGQKGIMSYIYGLTMLEICEESKLTYTCEYTRESIILTLLSLQLSDGGYTLSGDEGDVDVTAMALRSLSHCYTHSLEYNFTSEEKELINNSIDASISFLISNQLPTGAYASYGNACSESTAQVILAVSALSLDFSTFINNDNSLLDGLLLYRMPDGSFSHTDNPAVTNDMASAQSFEALCSICRTFNISLIYAPDATPDTIPDASFDTASEASSDTSIDSTSVPYKHVNIKLFLYLAIAAVALIAAVIFTVQFLHSKKRKRYLMQLFSVILAAAISLLAVYSINISSRNDYLTAPSNIIFAEPNKDTISITFSIDCYTIESNETDAHIYPATSLYVAKASTVFDVLTEICRINDIQLDYESNSVYGTAYIKGINSLYEYDYGDLSGWMYRVNGEFPSVGCGYFTLSDGDYVEWLYTTNIGRDLEND